MIVEEKSYEVKSGERLDVVEIRRDDEYVFYSYNYKIKRGEGYVTQVRWDNLEGQPHVDKYDENGNLVQSEPCRKKSLKEIRELIEIFGKNLTSMDIDQL